MRKFEYTDHARKRMALRKVTEAMVEETVERPARTGFGEFGRPLAYRDYPHGTLKVVYVDEPTETVIDYNDLGLRRRYDYQLRSTSRRALH